MTLKLTQNNPYKYTIDVEHLFLFLRDDIIDATNVHVDKNTLILRLNTNKDATYSLYGQVLRRRIENQGHEIYIRNIQSLHFEKIDDIIHVELITINGEHYEKELQLYE